MDGKPTYQEFRYRFIQNHHNGRTSEGNNSLNWNRRMEVDVLISPSSRSRIVCVALVFCFLLASCGVGPGSDRISELARVTSPNGRLDAVLIMDIYGPAAGGGVNSNVYIVPKGARVNIKSAREVFSADPMSHAGLVWTRDHLLEIHYDVAIIHEFRNTWDLSEVETEDQQKGYYEVELRLMPQSEGSALRPDGTFRDINND